MADKKKSNSDRSTKSQTATSASSKARASGRSGAMRAAARPSRASSPLIAPWVRPVACITLGSIGLIALLSFHADLPSSNWLGFIGYWIAYTGRFLLGLCAIPLCTWLIFKGIEPFRTAPRPPSLPVLLVALATASSALLATLAAENYPVVARSFAGWVHVQILPSQTTPRSISLRYNLGGVPLYFAYKDIPHLNLRHLLSDRGLSLLAGCSLSAVAFILGRRRREFFYSLPEPLTAKSITPQPLTAPTPVAPPLRNLDLLTQARSLKSLAKPMRVDGTGGSESPKQASAALTPPPPPPPSLSSDKELSTSALIKKARAKFLKPGSGYVIPSIDLLTSIKAFDPRKAEGEISQQSRLLEETLLSFGIESKVGEVHVGPRLLSFEVHPAIGVKVQKIKALENDIALNLEARSLRIIAPIPGKAAVGIEIPTQHPQEVNFKSMLQSYSALKEPYAIPVILGKTATGEDVHFDLAKMPHMIIAGATGSGKSVCVNTIIMSIVLHATPDDIRLLMIDPKKVELTPYTRLPHMIAPVITEPHQAAMALRWLVVEMERRYEILKRMGLRHIESFNKRQRNEEFESSLGIEIPVKLPYMVGIIDELADLMMTSPADIETPIARIAQMARAVGIHLILATQRPSREVITGLIKANFPARIAFKVSSRINSQIILDEVGAEGLLGNGDMLFLHPTRGSLLRAQGSYIRDEDINRVVEAIEAQAGPNYLMKPDLLSEATIGEKASSEDELFESAKKLIVETGTASTTFLQRKLRIGYARAASLMDELESHGIVGKSDGGKARRVLIESDEEEALTD